MNKTFYSFPFLFLVLFLFMSRVAGAQSNDISPYSRYGIGDLQDQSSALNLSMGGTGIAYHNDANPPFFINLKNPASYAYAFIPVQDSAGKGGLKMATFEAGLTDNILNISSGGQTAQSNNTYLSYLALNIPVSKHLGLGMGLTPVSTEGYNISTNSTIDTNTVQNTYQGTGGVEKVFLGAAYAFGKNKNLSIGVNASYQFGNLTNGEQVIFPLNVPAFNTFKTENLGVHAFTFDFGMMYTTKLWNDWSLTLGGIFVPTLNLDANYTLFTVTQYNATTSTVDTIQDSGRVGKVKIPLKFGCGITIKKGDHFTFSLDYTKQYWSQYSYFGQSEGLIDSYTYGVGIQYVANKDYARNYWQRIQYRMGFSYGQNYLNIDNTPFVDKNVSFGLGLPLGPTNPFDHPAILNLAVQVGTMGTTSNNLLLQNYVKIMVGITFDDHWFDKRKFQ